MSKQAKEEFSEQHEQGIFLRGTVIGRTKKLFSNDNGTKVRYTYILSVNGIRYIVFCWGEHELYSVNIDVEMPIMPRTYVDKNGTIHTQYVIPTDFDNGEESF